MKLKQLWVAAALCALGSAASAQEVIKLGFAAPMTGAQAQYGKDMQNGVTLPSKSSTPPSRRSPARM